jgi:bifunctional ADP-heptose synthase (sugar kinase/adenylyltransferase)
VKSIYYPDCNTWKKIVKKRYLQEDKHLFEVISETETKALLSPETYRGNFDVVILCDFGHGLFTRDIASKHEWNSTPGFIALNCQTNSSNYGFNLFTKHNGYDYLSIDLREAKLALHDQNPGDVYQKIFYKTGGGDISITLGKEGAIVNGHHVPAFADKVVDAIGAGDAYFAITSLLMKLEVDPTLVGFMGNVFAGLKAKNLGNKPVDYNQYLKTLDYILK